jgi:hypothetical protein
MILVHVARGASTSIAAEFSPDLKTIVQPRCAGLMLPLLTLRGRLGPRAECFLSKGTADKKVRAPQKVA